jgi:hypothetical protein
LKEYKFVAPKSPISGGYAKGPLTFVVTDNLVVNPISSFNVVNYLERMKIQLNDLDERVVKIGVKEVRRSFSIYFHITLSVSK